MQPERYMYVGNEGDAIRLQLTSQAPLVRLTDLGGRSVYLNVNLIEAILPAVTIGGDNADGSQVLLTGWDEGISVRETPEVVYTRSSAAGRRV